MKEHDARPLLLTDGVVFTCQSCGDCCRGEWLIGVTEAEHARLAPVDWSRHDPALGTTEKFRKLPLPLLSGETTTFARGASGACVFLDAASRCGIHSHLGYDAKPQVCREFPYHFVDTPDGVVAGLSFACSAVLHHRGAPLDTQHDAVAAVLAGSARVATLPDPIVLYSGVDITWAQYRPVEEGLLAILADTAVPFPRGLMAGSLLIALAVSLARLEQRAGADRPRQTLRAALAELAAERYRRLVDVAATVRPPIRTTLSHLAPLYTWLEFSRRGTSRAGLVLALYRNFLRFRRRTGRLPDLMGEAGSFDVAEVDHVRFDAAHPDVDTFLREYWRHVIMRKTLVPMHGVFRGYQTMLVLYAFTRWLAKLAAHRAHRTTTTLDDVRLAVRLVEQRFILHARFADLFTLSPILTLLADRLYRQKGFVPRATLDPE